MHAGRMDPVKDPDSIIQADTVWSYSIRESDSINHTSSLVVHIRTVDATELAM